MKRFIAMVLALVMALSLVACGGTQTPKINYFEENTSIPTPDSFSEKIHYMSDEEGVHFYTIDATSKEDAESILATYYDTLTIEYGLKLTLKDGGIINLLKDTDYLGSLGLQNSDDGYIMAAYILKEPISTEPKELTEDDVEAIAERALYNEVVKKAKTTWLSADPDKTRYSIATLKKEYKSWSVKGTFSLYDEYGKYYKGGSFSITVEEDGHVSSCYLF